MGPGSFKRAISVSGRWRGSEACCFCLSWGQNTHSAFQTARAHQSFASSSVFVSKTARTLVCQKSCDTGGPVRFSPGPSSNPLRTATARYQCFPANRGQRMQLPLQHLHLRPRPSKFRSLPHNHSYFKSAQLRFY